jgi:hypothetical protein
LTAYRMLSISMLAVVLGLSRAAALEILPPPDKGKPYPGDKQTLPYEDVLDISDLVLAGTLKSVDEGKLELAVEKVLRGKFEGKEAAVAFSGKFDDPAPEADKPAVLFCLRLADGTLRLAADPPKGGGWLAEGEKLAEALVEASKDPAKGYASKDPAIRLSSAYRLASVWLAAPEGKKPKLPADIVETLIDGLRPGDLRGRNVNAASRNAIIRLLDCDINTADIAGAPYGVTLDDANRKLGADSLMKAWARAVADVKRMRLDVAGAKPRIDDAEVDRLIKRLGDKEWAVREEAQKALLAMGKEILAKLTAGAESRDAEISERCRLIIDKLNNPDGGPGGQQFQGKGFNLDRAKLFVTEETKAPVEKEGDAAGDGVVPVLDGI